MNFFLKYVPSSCNKMLTFSEVELLYGKFFLKFWFSCSVSKLFISLPLPLSPTSISISPVYSSDQQPLFTKITSVLVTIIISFYCMSNFCDDSNLKNIQSLPLLPS
jgi:hypothetical protein